MDWGELRAEARRLGKRDFQQLATKQRSDRFWKKVQAETAKVKPQNVADYPTAQIVARLNGSPQSPAVKRVSRFIRLFNRATGLNASFRLFFESREDMIDFLAACIKKQGPGTVKTAEDGFSTGWEFKVPQMQALNNELNKVLRELNGLAKRYKWHPFIRHFGYEMPSSDVTESWKARDSEQEWETRAIWWMCFRNGQWIEYFRQCKECGKWFFALAEHQSYCRDACRQRHASRSDEFKERRRLYMHRYRRDEKQREEQARTAARRKTK